MSGELRISVALCTYNGERFIEDQLTSVLEQSRAPVEVVVSDDGSSDRTVERVRAVSARFLASHPLSSTTVTVLENAAPLGVTANFAQAVAATTGELIALCDQDDVWAPGRLERLHAEFARRPELTLLNTDARLVDEQGAPFGSGLFHALAISEEEKGLIRTGDAFAAFLRRNLVTGATTIFRRDLLADAAPFPSSWVHDEWLALVAATVGRVDFLDDKTIDYRQHGANQIGVDRLNLRGKLARIIEPGAERNRRLLARAEAFADWTGSKETSLPVAVVEASHEKLRHEQARSALSVHRVLRFVPVLREYRTGRYSRYGHGTRDVARDLVQPLAERSR
ncbi:glycosyltransferase family 2 protein [Leifsonia poae]|uniref:glycosyltransferase family 2 protein n=1 Tax=Leifsonia poae TaxID=110933 RepID=UPI001CBE1CEF|nr:glycosyltransferase family 2 protein [Leifsonia poae]